LGYYFFFYSTGFEAPFPATAVDPAAPSFVAPLAINLLISFPFKDSISLLRSASDTLAPADPKTFLTSAAAKIIINKYRYLFCLKGREGRKRLSISWC
jgi:hypothetical protein